MKATRIAVGLLALLVVMVMFVTAAAALTSAYITISGHGRVWQFAPREENGRVTDVSAYYILNDYPLVEIPITISNKIITDKVITLVFETSNLPDLDPETFVTGVHVTADISYVVAGPGFAFARRPGG